METFRKTRNRERK